MGFEPEPELEVEIEVEVEGEVDNTATRWMEPYGNCRAHIQSRACHIEVEHCDSNMMFGPVACLLPSGIVACLHHSASSYRSCRTEANCPAEDMRLDHTRAKYWACHDFET